MNGLKGITILYNTFKKKNTIRKFHEHVLETAQYDNIEKNFQQLFSVKGINIKIARNISLKFKTYIYVLNLLPYFENFNTC